MVLLASEAYKMTSSFFQGFIVLSCLGCDHGNTSHTSRNALLQGTKEAGYNCVYNGNHDELNQTQ
jgi:hypothetical protein